MKIIHIIITTALLVISGCTQNNGYIGPIFGSWSLMGISQNGSPLSLEDKTVFSFQNEIVQVEKVAEPPHSSLFRFGNFHIDHNILTLQFQDRPTANDSHIFLTPTWLYFPQDGLPIKFKVEFHGNNKMQWTIDNGPWKYTYTFIKTW